MIENGDLTAEESEVSSAVQGLSFLIADPTSSRRSVRKLLSYFRIKPNLIDVVESYSDAKAIIENKKPNVIFADYEIGNNKGMELLGLHQNVLPSPPVKAFFLISSKDSNALASAAAAQDADAVMVKPLTFKILQDHFKDVMKQKGKPSPYLKAIDAARETFEKIKHPKEALKIIILAKRLDPKPTLACYYEGLILHKLKRLKDATEAYEEGLRYNPTHFRCLNGLMDVLVEKGDNKTAYEVGRRMAENHSVPISRIPDLIKLSVLNHKYDEALKFSEAVDNISQVDDLSASYLAAGIVVCGLYFLQINQIASAISALHRAEVACKGNPKILKRILSAYISAGLDTEMKNLLGRVPDEVRDSPEVKLSELYRMQKQGEPTQILRVCLDLIRQGIKDETLYETAIKTSVVLKRKRASTEDIVWRAIKDYPEKQSYYESLLPPPTAEELAESKQSDSEVS